MPDAMLQACSTHSPLQSTQRNATQLTRRGQDTGDQSNVPDAPMPVDKSIWVRSEMARIEAEAAALTPESVSRVCSKFRREIGGLYEFVAAHIEASS